MWYTCHRKLFGSGDVGTIPEPEHNLIGGYAMTTLPHHVPEDNPYVIYALIDQRDFTTRYIGITDDVYARFAQHLRGDGCNPEKDAWIAELKADNVMLIMKTLEVVRGIQGARDRETFWIHHYRFLGAPLYNLAVPTIRIASTPPRIKSTSPRSNNGNTGRKHNYDKVREFIIHRHLHKAWPVDVSEDMQRKYEFYYFTKPKRAEQAKNEKRYAQHVRSYERGRNWIAELEQA